MSSLFLWPDFAVYRGKSFATTRHSHFYAQLVIGLEKKVRMAGRDGVWYEYDAAWVPSALSHQTEATADGFCILLIDPLTSGISFKLQESQGGAAGAFELAPRLGPRACEEILALTANPLQDTRDRILGILRAANDYPGRQTDPRVLASIEAMLGKNPAASLPELARQRGISPSRFRHLFREETGITFSGYRLWLKMRGAVLELAKDTDLGRAALNGGFADQSHFNRIVRRSFGFTPTWFVQSGLQVKTFLA